MVTRMKKALTGLFFWTGGEGDAIIGRISRRSFAVLMGLFAVARPRDLLAAGGGAALATTHRAPSRARRAGRAHRPRGTAFRATGRIAGALIVRDVAIAFAMLGYASGPPSAKTCSTVFQLDARETISL